ncbi:hypothetical protein KR222_011202 [Zaprionus bogoriensis]|nr:hypothetical protein KR222_011202 [Zaprionus bogoriensis]
MRKRDLHILTTNIYTYTGDQRFSIIHPSSSNDWDLKIEYAQPRDSGIYECQVNTEPKINLAITLQITAESDLWEKNSEKLYHDPKAARAKILGSSEIHVKRDSTIALACSVNIHASSVLW